MAHAALSAGVVPRSITVHHWPVSWTAHVAHVSLLGTIGELLARCSDLSGGVWGIVCSTIAIVAVDFRAFPRRFAKCESFGVSLMDAGVGSFMLSAGVVASQSATRKSNWRNVLRRSGAMLVIGVVKLIVHSSIEYQV